MNCSLSQTLKKLHQVSGKASQSPNELQNEEDDEVDKLRQIKLLRIFQQRIGLNPNKLQHSLNDLDDDSEEDSETG